MKSILFFSDGLHFSDDPIGIIFWVTAWNAARRDFRYIERWQSAGLKPMYPLLLKRKAMQPLR